MTRAQGVKERVKNPMEHSYYEQLVFQLGGWPGVNNTTTGHWRSEPRIDKGRERSEPCITSALAC